MTDEQTDMIAIRRTIAVSETGFARDLSRGDALGHRLGCEKTTWGTIYIRVKQMYGRGYSSCTTPIFGNVAGRQIDPFFSASCRFQFFQARLIAFSSLFFILS
jgi:hypothetical protein